MDLEVNNARRLRWRAATAVTIGATLAVLALVVVSANLLSILSVLLVLPAAVVVLLFSMWRLPGKSKLLCVGLLCLFGLANWQLLKHAEPIRIQVRWLMAAKYWKTKVLQQPPRDAVGTKCGIWDGWGFAGSETDVYLVFSPDDKLHNYTPANLEGLPSPVWHVQRLEKQWYSVTFFTNEGWDGCAYFQ